MICAKCRSPHIDLKNTRNQDTGLWSNYWWCLDCDAKTHPDKSPDEMKADGEVYAYKVTVVVGEKKAQEPSDDLFDLVNLP